MFCEATTAETGLRLPWLTRRSDVNRGPLTCNVIGSLLTVAIRNDWWRVATTSATRR